MRYYVWGARAASQPPPTAMAWQTAMVLTAHKQRYGERWLWAGLQTQTHLVGR
jgi:hypothetical protein